MFHPFVTGSIFVIFARDISVQLRMRGMRLLGEDDRCSARYRPTCSRRLKILSPETLYNIIISVMYGVAHSLLNGRHLSSVTDDAGYLLPFSSPTLSSFTGRSIHFSLKHSKKIYFENGNEMLISRLFMFYCFFYFTNSLSSKIL